MPVQETRRIEPLPGPAWGVFAVPASKSVLNRALACAALAGGTSRVTGASGCGTDVRVMAEGLRALGVPVAERAGGDVLEVRGGGGTFVEPEGPVRVGEAGTAARFLTALACLARGQVVLEAGPRMSVRPMRGLLETLASLGARVERLGGNSSFPVRLEGGGLRGGTASVEGGRTSQFASALLLLGPALPLGLDLRLEGETVSLSYVEMTARVADVFGGRVRRLEGGSRWVAEPGGYRPADLRAPGDASSALVLLAAAAVTGGEVAVEGVDEGWDQPDLEAVGALAEAGCRVEHRGGTLRCAGPPRRGIRADLSRCPDAAHPLAAVAAVAPGPSLLTGLSTLPAKESDRLAALAQGLTAVGCEAIASGDRLEVRPAPLHGAVVDSRNDHRVAMTFALLGLRVRGIEVRGAGCVEKSWPRFWDTVEELRRASS